MCVCALIFLFMMLVYNVSLWSHFPTPDFLSLFALIALYAIEQSCFACSDHQFPFNSTLYILNDFVLFHFAIFYLHNTQRRSFFSLPLFLSSARCIFGYQFCFVVCFHTWILTHKFFNEMQFIDKNSSFISKLLQNWPITWLKIAVDKNGRMRFHANVNLLNSRKWILFTE